MKSCDRCQIKALKDFDFEQILFNKGGDGVRQNSFLVHYHRTLALCGLGRSVPPSAVYISQCKLLPHTVVW